MVKNPFAPPKMVSETEQQSVKIKTGVRAGMSLPPFLSEIVITEIAPSEIWRF